MAYMGYCRFRNTRIDLDDCLDSLREGRSLDTDEAAAGLRMFGDFLDFCRENGIIEDYDEGMAESLFGGLTGKEDAV